MGIEAPSKGVQGFSGSKRQLAWLGMGMELARIIDQRSIDYPGRSAISVTCVPPSVLTMTSGYDLVKLVPFVQVDSWSLVPPIVSAGHVLTRLRHGTLARSIVGDGLGQCSL